jgi:hypothetical protein
MKTLITTIAILLTFQTYAQISKSQVTTMIATAVKVPNDKNISQDAIIKKLVADTVLKSKKIAEMNTQIATTAKLFQDSVVKLKALLVLLAVTLDSTQFKVINKIATIPMMLVNDKRLTDLELVMDRINKATQ